MGPACERKIRVDNKSGFCRTHKRVGVWASIHGEAPRCAHPGCTSGPLDRDNTTGFCRTHIHVGVRADRRCGNAECSKLLRNHNKTGFCAACAWHDEGLALHRRLAKYGLSVKMFDDLLESQSFACRICRIPLASVGRNTHIDHDHACCKRKAGSCGKCIRAILCSKCNTGLGQFNDSPDLLRAAARYLELGSL